MKKYWPMLMLSFLISGCVNNSLDQKVGTSLTTAIATESAINEVVTDYLPKPDLPDLSATSWVVVATSSGTVVVGKDYLSVRPPASMTKLMTALVAINNYTSEEVIKVDRASASIGKTYDLNAKAEFTANNLIRIMLIGSGNDAALALADHHKLGYSGFVKDMNILANKFGMNQTTFKDVSGLDIDGHVVSALDMASLGLKAFGNELIAKTLSTPSAIVKSIDGKYVVKTESTNELLTVDPRMLMAKTGTTETSGECLTALAKVNNNGYVIVIMNSNNRFGDFLKIADWLEKI